MFVKLSSVLENIAQLEIIVQRIFDRYDLPQDRYPDVLISITEAVNNAICHGNNFDENKSVNIQVHHDLDGLKITISDEGKGFDLNAVADPTSDTRLNMTGGRGIFLIHHLADDVTYLNQGRTVDIVFNL